MDLTRRSAVLAAMVSALTLPARAEVKPFVLAVGHISCPNCMAWGREAGDDWKASPQFQRVDYRRWDASNVHQIGREQEWPADLQWVYRDFVSRQAELEPENYAKLKNANILGSPRFFLIQNGKLTNSAVGLNGWKYRIVPLLNQLVGS